MSAATDSFEAGSAAPAGATIRVRGSVQGVGFRPTVWRLARECGLAGEVYNDAEGVLIRVFGASAARAAFVRRLRTDAPPLARIDSIECRPLTADSVPSEFVITPSRTGEVHTGIVADAAVCEECLLDVATAGDRRYRYPFTNCTHCGPRLSIVRGIPYDRGNTSMQPFALCARCRVEYEDPADRRFHAQPNACPDCGPRLWLENADGSADTGKDCIEGAQRLLRAGEIVAIKGIGGIHLACDASNEWAVNRLRRRKLRYHKPFAMMARDVAMVRRYCHVGEAEAELLDSTAAPIVLLDARSDRRLAPGVAPAQRTFGFMLPYSPLHALLLDGMESPIVLTSGNRAEEPQCITNDEARLRLGRIADALLLHDREIINRLDDSVARLSAGHLTLLRRARGYAPASLSLPAGFQQAPPILACGGELKNTFCLLRNGEAILSQHLGDLENASANAAYQETLELYLRLFAHRPRCISIDSHPEYLPSKLGRERALSSEVPLVEIQHHHAHIAACLADNDVALNAPPVLGVALDGIGYGSDDTLWGGEILLADYRQARRVAAFASVRMPGGAQAIRQPWRMAYAHLARLGDVRRLARVHAGEPFFRLLGEKPLDTLDGMVMSGFNSPQTSSCGRLFDAVAAVTGLCFETSYEGQAAIELEAAIDRQALNSPGYPFAIETSAGLTRIEPRPMWQALLADLQKRVKSGVIAARFHSGLANAIVQTVFALARTHGDDCERRVALSGGVLQNVVLADGLRGQLEARGFTVYVHQRVPANDGGLSLGQAVIAAARTIEQSNGANDSCA